MGFLLTEDETFQPVRDTVFAAVRWSAPMG